MELDREYTRNEAARGLEINGTMFGPWIKDHQSDDAQAFRGNGKLTLEQEEIRKLKTQVKRLEMVARLAMLFLGDNDH